MQKYFADLHIHIGQALGKPVKITASRHLTLDNILFYDAMRKGLDIVGVVDAGTANVFKEIKAFLAQGKLKELSAGGFMASNGILLIAGAEIESSEGVHLIVYFPNLSSIEKWQKIIAKKVKNLSLSTQKADISMAEIINISQDLGGIFCPAHVFTPHKGVYGFWTKNLFAEIGYQIEHIDAIELGLSADSDMADRLAETKMFPFLSNSDAHSGGNIGREFNVLQMERKDFDELKLAITNQQGREIISNNGLNPWLGKYHRSYCPYCDLIFKNSNPILSCPHNENHKIILGVYDRILSICDYPEARHPEGRPPYFFHIPLKEVPGVGSKTYLKLLKNHSEIEVMTKTDLPTIAAIAGQPVASMIHNIRTGNYSLIPGGGGHYGKVKKQKNND